MRRVLVAAARPKWNIRIAERYPHGRGVMKYLARYVRGGPIKDHRLVRFDGQEVTFRYGNHRERDARGKPQQAELTLSVAEFLRRWSEHVPLPGVHTVRAWGLYASTQRREAGAVSGATAGGGAAGDAAVVNGRAAPGPRPPLGAVSGVSAKRWW